MNDNYFDNILSRDLFKSKHKQGIDGQSPWNALHILHSEKDKTSNYKKSFTHLKRIPVHKFPKNFHSNKRLGPTSLYETESNY